MKIGVVAGTIVDTKMGCDQLLSYNFEPISFPMSQNCDEQSSMQYYSKEELENLFTEKCKQSIEAGAKKVFLYCNSLSCAVDYEKVSKELGIQIITPLDVYKNLPKSCKNVAILAANGLSAFIIDKIIHEYNSDVNTITVGNISIVQQIENGEPPKEIIKKLNLDGFVNYLKGIQPGHYKIDSLILGCTHFPYLKSALEEITDITVIDPTKEMIDKI